MITGPTVDMPLMSRLIVGCEPSTQKTKARV